MENVRFEKIASVKNFETSSLFNSPILRANQCDLRIRPYENFLSLVRRRLPGPEANSGVRAEAGQEREATARGSKLILSFVSAIKHDHDICFQR